MRFQKTSLFVSVALVCALPSPLRADVWSIDGLIPSRELGLANEAFDKARAAKDAIAQTPQKAIDTVSHWKINYLNSRRAEMMLCKGSRPD